ncbi:MAG TPA: type II toxin-antitoxin system RelE/ParE family toxin [Bryobacteraceae bacterium]|nr:transposase [Bryobacterales bacterium]HRJ21012.1 type II toxin-antitoxin system RelE/ParE family toxin [Bryobacteraceae bacterium]
MAGAPDRPLLWLKGEVKTPPFSPRARLEAGFLLRRLQRGEILGMPQSRPMPSIGMQCHELRIEDRGAAWRIIYHLAPDAVIILEVFSKKTAATPAGILAVCRKRLSHYLKLAAETEQR